MKSLKIPKTVFRGSEVCVLLLITALVAHGQTGGNAIQLTAAEFEKEVTRALDAAPNGADPTVCRGVIERLKADRHVSDHTVVRCLEAHINADDQRAQATRSTSPANRYMASNQFIAAIIDLMPDRELLRAHLLARGASLAVATSDFPRATGAFEAALKAVQPVRLEADLQWMTTLVSLGQSLLSQNRNQEAESYFLQALSYEWYTIVGFPDRMRMLRDKYIEAGRGLIACRRGNLKALRDIVFVPATEEELRPALEKAIQEANTSR